MEHVLVKTFRRNDTYVTNYRHSWLPSERTIRVSLGTVLSVSLGTVLTVSLGTVLSVSLGTVLSEGSKAYKTHAL